MVRTMQGAPSTVAGSTDHTRLGPTPAFHLTDPHRGPGGVAGKATTCWAMPHPEHPGLSTPSSKPGHHTMSKTGQGHPSRKQSSPLPGTGGSSVAIMPSSLADVHLATHWPHSVVFCLSLSSPIWATELESPFLLMFWSMKEKSTYRDCKRLWVQAIKALFYCQDPSVSPFPYSMLRLHLFDKTSAS